MSRKVFALLVGINNYQNASKLKGCLNDVEALHHFLVHRVKNSRDELSVKKLLDEHATRTNIIKCFENFLTQAGPDDVALFYFSGHGSQAPVNSPFLVPVAIGIFHLVFE